MENLAEKLKEILGEKGWVTGAGAAPWQRDWLNRYGEMPLGVARPNSTAQVAQVMAACPAAGGGGGAPGGETGVCGGGGCGGGGGGGFGSWGGGGPWPRPIRPVARFWSKRGWFWRRCMRHLRHRDRCFRCIWGRRARRRSAGRAGSGRAAGGGR